MNNCCFTEFSKVLDKQYPLQLAGFTFGELLNLRAALEFNQLTLSELLQKLDFGEM